MNVIGVCSRSPGDVMSVRVVFGVLQKPSLQQQPRSATRVTVSMEKKLQAYSVLNRFFQGFIDHVRALRVVTSAQLRCGCT